MQPNLWNRSGQPTPFHDKAFHRSALPAWHERWQQLSTAARQQYIAAFPLRVGLDFSLPPVSLDAFSPTVRDELIRAGFVYLGKQGSTPAIIESLQAESFGAYVRGLNTFHPLLNPDRRSWASYVQHAFATYTLNDALRKILDQQGFKDLGYTDVVRLFPHRRQWPGWVAEFLVNPVLHGVLDAVENAGGRLRWVDLPARLPNQEVSEVRFAQEQLVTYLALFEDVDPSTGDILVGFLPATWEDLQRNRNPQPRPELIPQTPVGEQMPEQGYVLADLRSVLLELTVSPARVKQDGSLYKADEERLDASLVALPDSLRDALNLSLRARRVETLSLGRGLHFLSASTDGPNEIFGMLSAGADWLKLDANAQFEALVTAFREQIIGPTFGQEPGDLLFLGFPIASTLKTASSSRSQQSHKSAIAHFRPLREAVYAALNELPAGQFCSMKDFIARAVHGRHNPLFLGRSPAEVSVRLRHEQALPLEQELTELGETFLSTLIRERLIPLGCLQAALNETGQVLIARRPQLEVYFGKASSASLPPASPTRIVVQPDFTIVVMGTNPAAAADLVPFCERVRGNAGSNSLTLRLTRDLVLKAISDGLSGEEVLERLERLATTPLPGNVAHEVREWCGWVRRATVVPASLVRCPDRATADRVQSALGKKAERLNDTTVAFTAGELSSAEKQKLQKQGVFLDVEELKRPKKKKTKRK